MRLGALLLLAAALSAATPQAWELRSYQDLLSGTFRNVQLDRDGTLRLAGQLTRWFTPDEASVWALARAKDGTVYAATGHRGNLYRIAPGGQGTLLWTAPQPEIFALALDAQDRLYFATSPNGRLYRWEGNQAKELYTLSERYVWSLAAAPDGTVYAATGDRGRLYRIAASGQAEVWYETGQAHITALAFDAQGRLLAGTEPNGLVYRIDGKNQAFVVHDADLPEIRTLAPQPDGSVLILALGGSVAKRTNTPASSTTTTSGVETTAPTISVTVTGDAAAQQPPGVEVKPPAPGTTTTSTSTATTQTTTAGTVEATGVERSSLIRLRPDGTSDVVWTSQQANAYDVAVLEPDRFLLATDVEGRIEEVTNGRQGLLAQTGEGETLRLLRTPEGLLIATGSLGRVYRLTEQPQAVGTYESPVHDAKQVARWGRFAWAGTGAVSFSLRAGNTPRPDATWSAWIPATGTQQNGKVALPNARYVQWRAELRPAGGQSPAVRSATLHYLLPNAAPVLRTVNVSGTFNAANTAAPTVSSTSASAAYSVTVTDTGEVSSGVTAGAGNTQTINRTGTQQLLLVWVAEDPDGDRLVYDVSYRAEGEREWQTLRQDMAENTLVVDAANFADGRYEFRVVASDRAVNPGGSAREAELTSPPVLLDTQPPAVSVAGRERLPDGRWRVRVTARDQQSALRRCEYSLNGQTFVAAETTDGISDSPEEAYELIAPAAGVLTVRVVDVAGNSTAVRLVLAPE